MLISREPNINVFRHFSSSSPGVYTRVGFLFSFLFSFSVVFLHSKASSKCKFGRGMLLQCLGHHHFPQVWLLDGGTAPWLSPQWWQLPCLWDMSRAGFWMCCIGGEGKGSCAHHSSLGAALKDGSLSPSLSPAFPQLPSSLGLGRQLGNGFIACP